jgi:DNA-binding FrmR family transcriptional regulator
MTHEVDKKLVDRLSRVEGQIRGLRKMLEEGRNCEEVLNQLLAARSGLERAGMVILDRHLADCILEGADVAPERMDQLRHTLRLWSRHTSPEA